MDGYFHCPRIFVRSTAYRDQRASTLTYLSLLSKSNRLGNPVLRISNAELAKITGVTRKTVVKSLTALTADPLPFLRVNEGTIEILNPHTGQSFDAEDPNIPQFIDRSAGKSGKVLDLLTPANFHRYFCAELPDLDSSLVQQDTRCPFHSDEHPSMSVNLDEGVWFCHSCKPENSETTMLGFEMRKLQTEDRPES